MPVPPRVNVMVPDVMVSALALGAPMTARSAARTIHNDFRIFQILPHAKSFVKNSPLYSCNPPSKLAQQVSAEKWRVL